MTRSALALTLASLLAACGGSDSRPAGETTPPGEKPAGGGHHHALTPELDAFHEVLAPRWHAEPGPARTKDTCAALPEFRARAAAVKSAAAPAGASADAWSQAGAALEESVGGLESACAGSDQKAFDSAFASVHDAFHGAMKLAAAGRGQEGHSEHHEQGEHGHGDHEGQETHGHQEGGGHGKGQHAEPGDKR